MKKLRYVLISLAVLGSLIFLSSTGLAVSSYDQVNLVSDLPGVAPTLDPNLVNPWGLTNGPTTPFWASDNGAGVSTLYTGNGIPAPVGNPLIVTIPPPNAPNAPSQASPTGVVFNGTTDFQVAPGAAARFIFATEDGTIAGWNPTANPTNAILKVNDTDFVNGPVYKGIALANNGSQNLIYVANFRSGTIDVFDANYNPKAVSGTFKDTIGDIPSNFAPFNIQNIGGKLFVTYAMQDATKHDDVAGAGNGYVNVFDANGNFLQRLVTKGPLNSPWGMTIAPANFGDFSNKLLIGNFGDGTINVFDPVSGVFLGNLMDRTGNPITIDGLWGLQVGNGTNDEDPNKVFFNAGIAGPDAVEDHGLFGNLAPSSVPEPATVLLLGLGIVGIAAWRKIK